MEYLFCYITSVLIFFSDFHVVVNHLVYLFRCPHPSRVIYSPFHTPARSHRKLCWPVPHISCTFHLFRRQGHLLCVPTIDGLSINRAFFHTCAAEVSNWLVFACNGWASPFGPHNMDLVEAFTGKYESLGEGGVS